MTSWGGLASTGLPVSAWGHAIRRPPAWMDPLTLGAPLRTHVWLRKDGDEVTAPPVCVCGLVEAPRVPTHA